MDVTDASLRDRYSKMGTEELIDLVRNSDLTDSASKILNQTLSERGVTEEDQTRRVKEASMEEKKLRSKIGFQWWVVWAWLGIILGNLVVFIELQESLVIALIIMVFNSVLMIMVLKYNKYAFLIATILSLNPLLWIINGIYLKNRWHHPKVNKRREGVFCTKCGTENSNDDRNCRNCGTTLPHVAPTPPALPNVNEDLKASDSIQDSDKMQTLEPNFLVKHWRGDYSLGVSYWVIGFLLTVIVFSITTAIGSTSVFRELGPKASGVVILSSYVFFIMLTLWQLVGVWRSADKHTQRGGIAFWAGLAKVMVILGLLRGVDVLTTQGGPILSEGFKLLVGIDETPPHQVRLLRDGTELELAGGMPFGTTETINKILDAAPAVQIIHLNSQGGRMNEAYKLYKTIKERGLSTYTSADCTSACSIAFLAGQERYLGEDGRLGFHSTSIGELSGVVVKELNDEVRLTLQTHGVPNSFIDRALSTSPEDMWYPSKDELLEAKVIDSVVDSRYFGLSGITQWRDAHKIESGLLAIPIYSALAQYDQQNYTKLRDIIVSGIQKGRAQIEIENDLRSIFMDQLFPAYLKKAPDEVLIRYWSSQVAEMKYLENLDPQYCADFIFPQFAKSAQDLQHLLPKDLQTEDIDSLVAVVIGVATNPQGYGSNARIQADLEEVVAEVTQQYPWALGVILNPADYKDDPAALCGATIALASEVLAIPSSSRSGAVLRYMLSE